MIKYFKIKYPKASESKQAIMDRIGIRCTGYLAGVPNEYDSGHKSSWYFHNEEKDVQEICDVITWIESVAIPNAAHVFSLNTKKYKPTMYNNIMDITGSPPIGGGEYGFDIKQFRITECWANIFNNNEGLRPHNHFPYTMSFAYYVNLPEGSANIMLDGESVAAEEGECIIFPSNLEHQVPPNTTINRMAIIGNVLYVKSGLS